jgi:hypothetical protein
VQKKDYFLQIFIATVLDPDQYYYYKCGSRSGQSTADLCRTGSGTLLLVICWHGFKYDSLHCSGMMDNSSEYKNLDERRHWCTAPLTGLLACFSKIANHLSMHRLSTEIVQSTNQVHNWCFCKTIEPAR